MPNSSDAKKSILTYEYSTEDSAMGKSSEMVKSAVEIGTMERTFLKLGVGKPLQGLDNNISD